MIQNHSLKPYNTFGIDVKAKNFSEVTSEDEIINFLNLKPKNEKLFLLNGGSNMLLTKDIDAWVMKINLKGIRIIEENEFEIIVEAQAGENWHEFVLYCIEQNWGGLENLSLIPGHVGASPIQNIGAYGIEIKDVFHSLKALNIQTLKKEIFKLDDCKFGYRDSVFKHEKKDQYIITSVQFKLSKVPHKISMNYGVIEQELAKSNITYPTIKDISNAIISIRKTKLPDPKILGNSGSFFKNPIINHEFFNSFIAKHPKAPFYDLKNETYKIPAGWLIEQAGFKGYRSGDAGVHKNQALVLVNYGNASGNQILELSKEIQHEVQKKFGITITPEVNLF